MAVAGGHRFEPVGVPFAVAKKYPIVRSIDAQDLRHCRLLCSGHRIRAPGRRNSVGALIRTWHGPRHETQYPADGTWILDPPDEGDNTRGKWRIEHGRLIGTWRSSGESSDSTSTEEIIELTEKILKFRIISQDGPGKPERQVLPSQMFTVMRVMDKKYGANRRAFISVAGAKSDSKKR